MNKAPSTKKFLSDYRCSDCGGRLTERYQDDWYTCCARCGGVKFIHERQWQEEKARAVEVIDGLPPELAAQFQEEELPPLPEGVFPLGQEWVDI